VGDRKLVTWHFLLLNMAFEQVYRGPSHGGLKRSMIRPCRLMVCALVVRALTIVLRLTPWWHCNASTSSVTCTSGKTIRLRDNAGVKRRGYPSHWLNGILTNSLESKQNRVRLCVLHHWQQNIAMVLRVSRSVCSWLSAKIGRIPVITTSFAFYMPA
jgi:hypothetical protein